MWKGSLLQHDFSSFFWLLVQASSRAVSKVFVQCSEPHFPLMWSHKGVLGLERVIIRFILDLNSFFHINLPPLFFALYLLSFGGIPLLIDETLKLISMSLFNKSVHPFNKICFFFFFFFKVRYPRTCQGSLFTNGWPFSIQNRSLHRKR